MLFLFGYIINKLSWCSECDFSHDSLSRGLTGWRSHRRSHRCVQEVLSFYCSDLFTKCDVIAKFLGSIYRGLSKVCVAVGAHLIPVIQGKSNRIYAAKMSSSSLRIDRSVRKIADFINCSFVVTSTNQVKLVIVLIVGQ